MPIELLQETIGPDRLFGLLEIGEHHITHNAVTNTESRQHSRQQNCMPRPSRTGLRLSLQLQWNLRALSGNANHLCGIGSQLGSDIEFP
jgi:hypothetical protein